MKRIDAYELEQLLICPECGGKLNRAMDIFVCTQCQREFRNFRDRPVLLKMDNELFHPSAYGEGEGSESGVQSTRSLKSIIKTLIPSKSVNLVREKMFRRISAEHCSGENLILIIGCGNQSQQLERFFQSCETVFVFCDIDKDADADVFCDSHCLPFANSVFDGVISTAVMEHVLYPDKVVGEVRRVLKDDCFIYSEIPFLQSVHEGAYDYTRYTMSGHRRLMEYFKESDSGIVAGPGTALVWSIDDFSKSISSNKRVSMLLSSILRFMFFWLKYFDYISKANPNALNSASCTYFYGVKSSHKVSATEIIESYRGNMHRHV